MADKKDEKSAPKTETKPEKQAVETVQLSAEELRKISGGAISPKIPPRTK